MMYGCDFVIWGFLNNVNFHGVWRDGRPLLLCSSLFASFVSCWNFNLLWMLSHLGFFANVATKVVHRDWTVCCRWKLFAETAAAAISIERVVVASLPAQRLQLLLSSLCAERAAVRSLCRESYCCSFSAEIFLSFTFYLGVVMIHEKPFSSITSLWLATF